MFERLPDWFDPLEFVDKKRRIKGTVTFEKMDRVRDMLLNRDGEARIELDFKREGRIAAISGRVEADLVLCCQCCLEPMDWPVRSDVRLGVVSSIDEADLLSETIEPLVVEPGSGVALADIVQDELLLAIPSIPQHPDCGIKNPSVRPKAAEHPFAVLAQLKETNRRS